MEENKQNTELQQEVPHKRLEKYIFSLSFSFFGFSPDDDYIITLYSQLVNIFWNIMLYLLIFL